MDTACVVKSGSLMCNRASVLQYIDIEAHLLKANRAPLLDALVSMCMCKPMSGEGCSMCCGRRWTNGPLQDVSSIVFCHCSRFEMVPEGAVAS